MSWSQAVNILRRDRLDRERDAAARPQECPQDGSPLEWIAREKVWFCPFDGQRFDGDGTER